MIRFQSIVVICECPLCAKSGRSEKHLILLFYKEEFYISPGPAKLPFSKPKTNTRNRVYSNARSMQEGFKIKITFLGILGRERSNESSEGEETNIDTQFETRNRNVNNYTIKKSNHKINSTEDGSFLGYQF